MCAILSSFLCIDRIKLIACEIEVPCIMMKMGVARSKQLRVQLLGGFQVWIDEEPIEKWDSIQTQCLFKILVLEHGKVVSNRQLTDYLWPNQCLDKSFANLRTLVGKLRRILNCGNTDQDNTPDSFIETTDGGYRFSGGTDSSIDIWDFSEAVSYATELLASKEYSSAQKYFAQAIALYKGDLLPSDVYADWATAQRARFKDKAVEAMLGLAECNAQTGEVRRAIEICKDACETAPCDQNASYRLMIYCLLNGSPTEALFEYQRISQLLEAEQNSLPNEAIGNLKTQIDKGERPAEIEKYPAISSIENHFHHSLSRIPYLGRHHELRSLYRCIEEIGQKQGKVVLVGGEAGIGKTRLVQEVLHGTEHKLSVLHARCNIPSTHVPYEPIKSAIRGSLLSLKQEFLYCLPSIVRSVLNAWYPDLNIEAESLEDLEPAQERKRLFEGLIQYIASLTENDCPIVLFLDDVQWADHSSLEFVQALINRVCDKSLLIICTYRTEELSSNPQLQSFFEIVTSPDTGKHVHIELNQLGKTEVELLLKQLPVEADNLNKLSQFLRRESLGNPLFIVSLIEMLFEDGKIEISPGGNWSLKSSQFEPQELEWLPHTIEEVLNKRLGKLSSLERLALDLISTFGVSVDINFLSQRWQRLAHLESIDPDLMWVTIDSLKESDYLSFDREYITFLYDKTRDLMYTSIEASRKRELHELIAEELSVFYEFKTDRPYAMLGRHFARAGLKREAIAEWVPATAKAVGGFNNEEGLEISANALELIDEIQKTEGFDLELQNARLELLRLRVRLLDFLGKREEQLATIEELIQTAEFNNDMTELGNCYLMRGQLNIDTAQYQKAFEDSEGALAILDNTDQQLLIECKATHIMGRSYLSRGNLADAEKHFSYEVELRKELGDDQGLALAMHFWGVVSIEQAHLDPALQRFQDSLTLSERIGDLEGQARAHMGLGASCRQKGLFDDAKRHYSDVRAIRQRMGDLPGEARVLGSLGILARTVGNYGECFEYLRQSSELHQLVGDVRAQAIDLNALGLANMDVGQYDRAIEAIMESARLFKAVGWESGSLFAFSNLSQTYRQLGMLEKALECCEQTVESRQKLAGSKNLATCLSIKADILFDMGRHEEADKCFEQVLGYLRDVEDQTELMLTLSNKSLNDLALGKHDEAMRNAHSAVDIFETRPETTYSALILYNHSRVLESDDQRDQSRAQLARAVHALLERSAKLESSALRESYFFAIGLHRNIITAFIKTIPAERKVEADCYELLRAVRWANSMPSVCICCEVSKVQRHQRSKNSDERRYKCGNCQKTFGDRTGTFFANRKLPLSELFFALDLCLQLPDPLIAREALQRHLEIHRKTAARLAEQIASAIEHDALISQLATTLFECSLTEIPAHQVVKR